MPVRDFLDAFQHNPETFDFATFKADLIREYDQDESVLTAKITDSDQRINMLTSDLQTQKLKNYDLLNKIPSEGSTLADQRQEQREEADISIDDLFGQKERADA